MRSNSNKILLLKDRIMTQEEYKKVNATYCDNLVDVLCVNQVRIDFTDKPITAWGGMGVLIGKFLEKIQFRDWVERHVPIIKTSPNAGGVYEKVLGQLLTVLGGGYRFAHSMLRNHGMEALKRVLCDTSFYQVDFIDHLEDNGYNYITAVPIRPIFQTQIMRINQWQPIDDGIQVAEFEFKHFDPKWTHSLRYLVIRQEIATRLKASGKQPNLFKELERS